jgi:hypothetical protein
VTLTASVSPSFIQNHRPTGSVSFYNGTEAIATIPVDANGNAIFTSTHLDAGSYSVTATYTGDNDFIGSTSNSVPLTITPSGFSFTLANTSITLVSEYHTTTTATVTSINSFADTLSFACVNPPKYLTCQINPASLTANNTLTVSLYLDTDSIPGFLTTTQRPHCFPLAFGPALAVLLLPLARRGRRITTLLTAVAGFIAIATLTGCGPSIILPPPSVAAGTYTIPINATGATTGLSHTATLTLAVTPAPPTQPPR